MIEKMWIQEIYRNKLFKLLSTIDKNPNLLTYNKDMQVIIKGELLLETDFKLLIICISLTYPNLDQVGTDRFIVAPDKIIKKPREFRCKLFRTFLRRVNKIKMSDDS